ncbi:MAG TPA: PhnD/SsuA/transferrin family substrate-binding protein [Planctomycetota bacterium]
MKRHSGPLVLGAVAYDAKVVTIWDGFRAWFETQGLTFDYVLFTNYERQVEAHFSGALHLAWNSPLAWIEAQRLAARQRRRVEAIAMRDSDRDLTSVVVVPARSSARTLGDLRGKRIGVGAQDSPQATLIPLLLLAEAGLEPGRDVEVVHHDVLLGKHGDHVGGERDAARALLRGEIEAACMLDANHLAFAQDGTLVSGATRVLAQTPVYDHCNFTVLDGAPAEPVARFRELLLGMSYDDPSVRRLLDLEGLKAWQPGRTSGYAQLERAVERFRFLEPWLAAVAG